MHFPPIFSWLWILLYLHSQFHVKVNLCPIQNPRILGQFTSLRSWEQFCMKPLNNCMKTFSITKFVHTFPAKTLGPACGPYISLSSASRTKETKNLLHIFFFFGPTHEICELFFFFDKNMLKLKLSVSHDWVHIY